MEWSADCDGEVLQATWRVARWKDRQNNPEAKMYSGKHGGAMTKPRKYTRLHLLGASKDRILHGICQDRPHWIYHNVGKEKYGVRCLFAQRRNERPADTVFVGLMELYAGDPFITQRKMLRVGNNDQDARRAVAVQVVTSNGHSDLLYADARPEKWRIIEGDVTIAAEYAYVSRDKGGLRQVTIAGGRLLQTPEMTVEVDQTTHGGKVVAVDYVKRRVTVEGRVPAWLAGHFFEAGGNYHRTSCEVKAIESGEQRSVLSLRKGLEIMRTRIREVRPKENVVVGAIAMIRVPGRDRELVASNDNLTRFWRVAYVGGNRHEGHLFRLSHLASDATGPVFTRDDFPPGSGISVWEFGVGDRMTIRTGVSLRRVEPGTYEVYATSPFTLAMAAKAIEVSYDRETWRAIPCQSETGRIRGHIDEHVIAGGRCKFYLRTK